MIHHSVKLSLLNPAAVSQLWAKQIIKAESPNPISSRDGLLLKRIPEEQRLSNIQLVQNLTCALDTCIRNEAVRGLVEVWRTGN